MTPRQSFEQNVHQEKRVMDGTYAPQSPDLSSFLSSPSKSQQPFQPSQSGSYAPQSPIIPSFNSHPTSYAQNPQFPLHHNQYSNRAPQQEDFSFGGQGEYSSYLPEIPPLPPAHSSFTAAAVQPGFYTNIKNEADYEYKPLQQQQQYDILADDGFASSSGAMSRAAAPSFGAAAPTKNPNPNNIEIKTKFPVARIKRIMQADEEVGKVAQVTPVAVSKALELFMISLVSGAAEKAREKGGKRVTAQHLKMVVQSDEQFDFLSEIVSKVADGVEAGGDGKKRKVKSEMDSDSEEEEKKSRKGKGRRKKGDD